MLLYQLQRRYTRTEIARLHQSASRWFVAQGLLEEAVHHALLADDAVGAAHIVVQHRHNLMNQDDWRRLNALLGVLPATVIETEPGLLLAQAWSAYNSYDVRHIPGLIDRAEALLDS